MIHQSSCLRKSNKCDITVVEEDEWIERYRGWYANRERTNVAYVSSGEIVHSSMYLVNNMAWLISHEYAIRMIFETYTVQLIKYCPTSVTDDRADPRSKNKMIQRIILNAFSIEGFVCTGALPSTYSGYLVLHFICTLAISNVMCHALTIRWVINIDRLIYLFYQKLMSNYGSSWSWCGEPFVVTLPSDVGA